jgi:hypothetical protein
MPNISLITSALIHTVYGRLRRLGDDENGASGSLDQVLWFIAVAVGAAVIAAIVWSKIKTEANKPVNAPAAP